MSKKTLTALVPVAAIVAFMALPALAQASRAQCGAGTECANGAAIRSQSSNLLATFQEPAGELKCTNSTFEGSVTNNQGETIEGPVTKDTLSGCTLGNGTGTHTVDISTNASVAAPWKLQVQQPDASGNLVAHLDPAAGSSIQILLKAQEFGFVVAECDFSTSTVQLSGSVGSHILSLTAAQFTLQSAKGIAKAECGTVNVTTAHLSGGLQYETTDATPKQVFVDMT